MRLAYYCCAVIFIVTAEVRCEIHDIARTSSTRYGCRLNGEVDDKEGYHASLYRAMTAGVHTKLGGRRGV